jgi:hypothetical protein
MLSRYPDAFNNVKSGLSIVEEGRFVNMFKWFFIKLNQGGWFCRAVVEPGTEWAE